MRYSSILLLSLLMGVADHHCAFGQEKQEEVRHPEVDHTPAASDRSFSIEIIEFHIDEANGADLSVEKLVELFAQTKGNKSLKRIEKIRFSALESKVSSVNFSKLVAVTTGSQSMGPGRPVVRNMRDVEIGTMAEVMVASVADKNVSMQLEYRASRLEGEGTEDSSPQIVSVSVKTSLVLELNKPRLLAGTSADPNAYVLIKVTE